MLVIDGEEQRRCPRRPILEDPEYYSNIFYLYRQYKLGYLVESGGLADQPAALMAAFKEIDTTVRKVESHREEQEAAKRRRNAVKGMSRGAVRR